MEWIIGIIIVIVILTLLTGKGRREGSIKSAIGNAYMRSPNEFITTSIYYEAGEKFAKDRGAEPTHYDDGGKGVSFDMLVNGKKVMVIFNKNRLNGTLDISVNDTMKSPEELIKSFKIGEY